MISWNNQQVTLEVLLLTEGRTRNDDFENCIKKHLHSTYISPANIKNNPRLTQDPDLLEMTDVRCKLTGQVKIESDFKNMYGTCFVERVILQEGKRCPCPLCETGETSASSYGKVAVSTALHILYDDEQSRYLEKMSQVILNYDKDEEEPNNEEEILYGFKVHSVDIEEDWCVLECVSHNMALMETLKTWIEKHYILGDKLREKYRQKEMQNNLPVIVITHPHGLAKQVSIGDLEKTEFVKELTGGRCSSKHYYNATTCRGSSGGSVYIPGKWLDGFGYWFGHSHCHRGISEDGKKADEDKNSIFIGQSSIGVESDYSC